MPKDSLARVYVVHGSEPLLVREEVQKLKVLAGVGDADAFDLTELEGSTTSGTDILGSVATAPFLADRRVVIVNRASRLDKYSAEYLADHIPKLPASALLILVFDPVEDPKRPSSALKALLPSAKKVGVVTPCELHGDKVKAELMSRTKLFGAKLSTAGLNALMEVSSGSISDAVPELEKCAIFVGQGGTIDAQVVKTVAVASREYKVFEMMDALVKGQLNVALRFLLALYEDSPKAEDAAMGKIFPLLSRQLRLVWQARAVIERNGGEPVEPKQNSLSSLQSFAQQRTSQQAKSLTLSQISCMMRSLAEADMRLKGQLPAASARDTVERLIAELCQVAARKTA